VSSTVGRLPKAAGDAAMGIPLNRWLRLSMADAVSLWAL
jgi:hypothetical protein